MHRQHYFDMDTVSQVGKAQRHLRKERRMRAFRTALGYGALAVVFGLIGAMLAWRG